MLSQLFWLLFEFDRILYDTADLQELYFVKRCL